MRRLRAWLARLGATLRPGGRERELREELEAHLQLHIDELVARGMSLEDARREARLALGGVAQTEELVRDRARLRGLESLLADVRFGARLVRRSPGFSAVAIVTLALGIGASTAVFSVVNTVLLTPLPLPRPDRLVLVGEGDSARATTTSWATFSDWRARSRSFEELAALASSAPVLGGDRAEQLAGSRVSAGFLRTLGVQPILGRDFRPEDDTRDGKDVAILGQDLWRRRFDADPDIVGRAVEINGRSHTVIGVLGSDAPALLSEATHGQVAQVLTPLGYDATQPWACRTCRHVFVVGRLADGVTRAAAHGEIEAVNAALAREHPGAYATADASIVGLEEQIVGPVRAMLLVLLGAVGLVLLIACVNLAHLLLARAARREREIAVRTALGASRGRVLRQLLVENCLLALLGAAAGLVPAWFVPEVLAGFGPRVLPRLAEIQLDPRVLLFALGLALATGVLSALAPALRLTRGDPAAALRDGGRAATGAGGRRLRGMLVAGELALSLALLAGAGLMVRSLWRLLDVPLGFEPANVLVAQLSLVGPEAREPASVRRHYDEVLARVRALPGVEAAALTSQVPLGGNYDAYGFHAEGRMAENPEHDPSAQRFAVTPELHAALRIPIVRGRGFTATDVDGAPRAILVNRTAAERVWPGEDPLGKRVKLGGLDEPWWTVVGVVGDVQHVSVDAPPEMQVYAPHAQWPDTLMLLTVRTRLPPLELAGAVERAARSVDPRQPVSQVTALDAIVARSIAARRLSLAMLAAFAAVALLLAIVGVYGVTSYAVAQRTRELGIRVALGAQPAQLLRSVLGRGVALALAGVGGGLVAALLLTRFLASLLYGVSPTDPATFAAVTLLLAAVATAACYLPARRVLRVDPTEPLRAE